ncbi:hypothetical protein [Halobacteriovorax sp. HLS]|uniref:hypothetical protein n=1 Tax=Halobacteriovorax sp. HLS TaxID=2234000 RepID=UPI000FD93A9C|nr:hypothetical protein [Halobacteriovorax sp. HLS]
MLNLKKKKLYKELLLLIVVFSLIIFKYIDQAGEEKCASVNHDLGVDCSVKLIVPKKNIE